ncbi:MAG: rhodanese-like domain-containing protein [bacterium]
MKRQILFLIPVILIMLAFFALQQRSLSAIEKIIAKEHPVPAISYQQLSELYASDSVKKYVLFDVRRLDEFEKSHLQNAVRVAPDLPAEKFIQQFRNAIRDKRLIFYCSVGYRSSILAEKVDSLAREKGALSLANLTGGIFRWYNENLPVFDANGETNAVHPYNAFWGKLLVKERN